MKKLLILILLLALGFGFYFLNKDNTTDNTDTSNPTEAFKPDPSSATFIFDGEPITFSRGIHGSEEGEISILDEKATGDLNNDGKADTVLLLANNSVGSGVFIYIAAYVSGPVNYKGTDALFVGDRISPQSISIANGVVTFKYLDREADESFAAEPTVPVTKQFVYKNSEFVER
jgi:hypothetical protein